MKLFDYTKWEVLETYECDGYTYCVQVRMNKRTGYKEFSVNKIGFGIHRKIDVDKINSLTEK